ncbi:MerR family transcriptional regulator [Candidatus Neomicrothrix sp.]|uniref:MerR family transcriptional regulator n=1 Tax=Candidatus Neomicrothrix subdominans TaxID=2954438 RepID=A0A936TE56_9ACTN|nr:MerR family transcriptional regulator [Candidatus Microthrix sp.]MBK9298346.1 MerR family transcriptional regulator [Candidatus Microthrix subdominans]MBK6309855.1 MerR family transcriptional regulator [Candidatus Microthrix sp.]MBK6438833.1 MerR family transcriptional regulator [Candidatus Microthrix sp.]MBK6968246.1 MerR family transcriptional regulator [Candidatus Microthrix sp.]MBK7166101.1 MerR family transcriptional regulator [Candidatus Microthrix sp.]
MAISQPNPVIDAGYSGKRTAEIVGISYRQLDYWARTDLLRPSMSDASGSGSRRRYSYRDLLELKVIKSLLDAGIKLEQVRNVFHYVKERLGEDVTTANLVIQGRTSVLVDDGEELIDVLRHGQGVLNVLPLGTVQADLDAAIHSLHPDSAPASLDGGTNADPAALAQ